ncbi:MAG: ABC transporter ATP-binding protein [Lachnospiraceae bacterium]|nr:ABC transporter ATP-binding protein [Lachnospiraceae bacterium]
MMVDINGLSKRYGTFEAIHDINIKIEKGMIHGIIGENGSGKTTLIKCIAGIYRPECGEVIIDGENVYENPKVKERLGYVADNNKFFPTYRLGKMMEFYRDVYKNFDVEKFKYLNHIFKLDMNKRVRELSKGQKMRLAFMLNTASCPDVLILDEPTSGLDVMAKKDLFDALISEVEERDLTVIISSHNLAEIERICDNISIIKNGTMAGQSDMEGIMKMARKFNFVFDNGAPDGFMSHAKLVSVKNVGNIYTVVFNGITDEEVEEFKGMQPVYMEEISVNLEEVFVYTNGGDGYGRKNTV